MEQTELDWQDGQEPTGLSGKGALLTVIMALIAGGFLPVFSMLFRPATWCIWIIVFIIVCLCARRLPLLRLVQPALPYYLWLLGFLVWGLIVSPVPNYLFGFKVAVTTLLIAFAMAVVTSEFRFLSLFANLMQWIVGANVALIPLMAVSPAVRNFISTAALGGEAYEPGITRFSGFWDNPNMAGYMCLIAILLSIWARPLAAWVGRLGALPVIYYAASRKSLLLLALMLLLNIVIVQRHHLNRMFLLLVIPVLAAIGLMISGGLAREARSDLAGDANVTRLMDITESNTAQAGGGTRVDLLHEWIQTAKGAPWFGYGFGAMAGRIDVYGRVIDPHLPVAGSHNTYVGVMVEVGLVGFVGFLLVLLHYSRIYLSVRGPTDVRWALLSFLACNTIILFVSHSHLFSFEGKTIYALFFLLPVCPALKEHLAVRGWGGPGGR